VSDGNVAFEGGGGRAAAHSVNCATAFVDMRVADALVFHSTVNFSCVFYISRSFDFLWLLEPTAVAVTAADNTLRRHCRFRTFCRYVTQLQRQKWSNLICTQRTSVVYAANHIAFLSQLNYLFYIVSQCTATVLIPTVLSGICN